MNMYVVSVYITEDHSIATELLVHADNKDIAIENVKVTCKEKGFDTYGYDYCDLC